ncbi:MAG: NAD(P)-dependent oxidoreductase [Candidatus Levybacteria bacterium]|nr:NAD(P)-dependent oxidoreductase [Candidatus Levybacteria bacterium]
MKKRILITGGAGFLGVHLARKLLKEGYEVSLFDIADLDAKDLIGKVKFIKSDVRDKKVVYKAIEKQDFVVHAAAALPIQNSKKLIFSVNVDGTRNILESCLKNKVKKVVFISSTAVYGVPRHLPETEESPIDPIGFYGESKVEAEKLCKKFMEKGLKINIIRPKTFLGPERLGVFELWFEAIYTGKRVFILGNGKNLYQLLAVSDIADAILKALTCKKSGEVFNIGAKEFGTWRSDLGAVIQNAKSKSKITSMPLRPSQLILSILERLNLSPIAAWHYKTIAVPSYVSIKKAEKLLDWHPKKSNKELLLESYKWYKKHRNEVFGKTGTGHRVGWNFKMLNLVKRFF